METPPAPDLIFRTLTAYQATAALDTAIEIDLFSAVAQGHRTPEALAQATGADARGVRSLADFLVVQGFLTKADDGYGLTDVSEHYLDRARPTFLGEVRSFLGSDELRTSFEQLTAAVRGGGQAYSEHGTTAAENPVWEEFARAMAPMMYPVAEQLAAHVAAPGAPPRKVLDVAAGHGLFGLHFAHHHDDAEIHGLDWPRVLDVAEENAQRLGFAERFRRIEGSAFDVDWGTGYDVVLLPNFLHHFDADGCVAILQRARAALADGGQVVALEIAPDDSRVAPPHPATFSLIMLATTPRGDAHTVAEYRQMFPRPGCRSSRRRR